MSSTGDKSGYVALTNWGEHCVANYEDGASSGFAGGAPLAPAAAIPSGHVQQPLLTDRPLCSVGEL